MNKIMRVFFVVGFLLFNTNSFSEDEYCKDPINNFEYCYDNDLPSFEEMWVDRLLEHGIEDVWDASENEEFLDEYFADYDNTAVRYFECSETITDNEEIENLLEDYL
jgi:hypothetical protein